MIDGTKTLELKDEQALFSNYRPERGLDTGVHEMLLDFIVRATGAMPFADTRRSR
jgi:hypothetical protein